MGVKKKKKHSRGKDKISKRIYKKNFTIIEEKKKARLVRVTTVPVAFYR